MSPLSDIKAQVEKLSLSYNVERSKYTQAKETIRATKLELVHAQEAESIIEAIAEDVQNKAHEQIAKTVSNCLSCVFDDPYEFKIVFDKKWNRTDASLVFVRDGEEYNPVHSSGGGAVDVAAFALRVACVVMSKPPLRRVLLLDEPFKFVSRQYRNKVREVLEIISKEMDVQIIMVTHIEELQAGNVVNL